MSVVAVSSSLDELRSRDVRFLEEAAKLGDLQVLLWADDAIPIPGGPRGEIPRGGAASMSFGRYGTSAS